MLSDCLAPHRHTHRRTHRHTHHRWATPDPQFSLVFDHFDADHGGSISYDEFLVGVRGELNERRQQLVLLAFKCLDKTGNNLIELDDIMDAYTADKHPDVIAGRKTKNQVLREFLDTFDSPDEKDGKVRMGCPCYAWLDPPPPPSAPSTTPYPHSLCR